MTIRIVNKYKGIPEGANVYCGRGSPLGNPYRMKGPSDRDRACDAYERYFYRSVEVVGDKGMVNQLNKIAELAAKGDVNLVCFCAPKRCHCETIKRYVDEQIPAPQDPCPGCDFLGDLSKHRCTNFGGN